MASLGQLSARGGFGISWDHQRSLGGELLRSNLTEALTGPGVSDVVCASLYALARREGSAATSDLATSYRDRKTWEYQLYAMIGLAVVGDDSVWDLAAQRLKANLARVRRINAIPPLLAFPLAYLLRNAQDRPDRMALLAMMIRSRLAGMSNDERAVLSKVWPAALDPSIAEPPFKMSDLNTWIRGEYMTRDIVERHPQLV